MKKDITYFEKGGKANTLEALNAAKSRAIDLGIKTLVIGSIRGQSIPKVLDVFKDVDINIIVSGCNGCSSCPPFDEEIWKKVEDAGHKVILVPEHSFPYPPAAEFAYRSICEGLKVCVHVAIGVAEKELVDIGTEVIAMGGTGWKGYPDGGGLDTAVVIEVHKAREFFSYKSLPEHKLYGRKIKEIICMPR